MTRTLVLTIVQLDDTTTPTVSWQAKGPGVVGQDIRKGDFRVEMPEDVQDTTDWVRQVLAASCEAI